jgi:hypothetical protein
MGKVLQLTSKESESSEHMEKDQEDNDNLSMDQLEYDQWLATKSHKERLQMLRNLIEIVNGKEKEEEKS